MQQQKCFEKRYKRTDLSTKLPEQVLHVFPAWLPTRQSGPLTSSPFPEIGCWRRL